MSTIGACNNIFITTTRQSCIGIPGTTQAKTWIPSLTEKAWKFQNVALWDTTVHTFEHSSVANSLAAEQRATLLAASASKATAAWLTIRREAIMPDAISANLNCTFYKIDVDMIR